MTPDTSFERRLRSDLVSLLDQHEGPHPAWEESPAFRRVTQEATQSRRWPPLRLLAVAALLAIGGAVGVGALLNRAPEPLPSVSDGWLSWSEFNGADYDIMFGRPGTQELRPVGRPDDGLWETCPQFSQDGRYLAYQEAQDDSSDTPLWTLVVARLDENGLPLPSPRRITVDEAAGCFEWSPDGSRVAFVATSGLHVVELDTGANVLVYGHGRTDDTARPDDFSVGSPAWSADGTALSFTKSLPTGSDLPASELWTVTLDGIATRLLPSGSNELIQSLEWSPGSSRIAIGGNRMEKIADGGLDSAEYFVRLVSADGSAARADAVDAWTPTDAFLDVSPVWSPDGHLLAYVRNGQVVVVEPGSSGSEKVVPVAMPGKVAVPVCVAGWTAAGDRLLVGAIDQPFIDRGVGFSLVSVAVDGQSDPVAIRASGGIDVCSTNLQVSAK